MTGGLSDEEIAELKRQRRRKLLRQAAGGAAWGVFFSVAPMIEVLFVCAPVWIGILVWREVVRSRKYGFWPGAGVRLAVVGGIVALTAWLPFKYEDRLVKPLSKAEYTLGELSEAGWGMRIHYPLGMDNQVVRVPRERVSMKKFIRSIETQTGLRARIGHCGNGATLLWGACPMGRCAVEERASRQEGTAVAVPDEIGATTLRSWPLAFLRARDFPPHATVTFGSRYTSWIAFSSSIPSFTGFWKALRPEMRRGPAGRTRRLRGFQRRTLPWGIPPP